MAQKKQSANGEKVKIVALRKIKHDGEEFDAGDALTVDSNVATVLEEGGAAKRINENKSEAPARTTGA